MNFYLKKLPTGRVYLSQIEPTEKEELLEVIDAEMWIRAREKVKTPVFHNYGHGYIN